MGASVDRDRSAAAQRRLDSMHASTSSSRGAVPGSGTPDVLKVEAANLVQQHVENSTPDLSARGALKRGKPTEFFGKRIRVEEEAAKVIQQSFRRRRVERGLRRRSFSKFGAEALDLIRRFVADPGVELYAEPFASRARLVLHFDVNKSILIADKAQDSDSAAVVNMLLAECAWGRLEPGPKWVPVGRLATDRPVNDPQLMTYRSYLDSFLLPFDPGLGPAAQAHNKDVKARRHTFKRCFTEPGQPGNMFRGVFDRLKAALACPPVIGDPGDPACRLFAGGERHMLPSFFNLLLHLQSQNREFCIVFRSFGHDLAEVAEEVNLFATGQHPHYPSVRMDGSPAAGGIDLRLALSEAAGAFFRATAKPDGSLLVLGMPECLAKGEMRPEAMQAAVARGGSLLTTFQEMHAALMDFVASGNRIMALRDYYPFWKAHNERSRAGKLLLLDPEDETTIQIFFDDNIGHGAAHIVDARDDIVGRHILKVEPLNAILDPHYFVRAVHGCVVNVLQKRAAALDARLARLSGHGSQERLLERTGPTGVRGARRRGGVANTSRRARDLWSVVNQRLVAVIRMRRTP